VSALVTRGVSVSFGGNHAVVDASCTVEAGEIFGLIGPNGAGKSTFLGSIAGLVTTESGEVSIDGRNLSKATFWKRCRHGLAMTFQTPRFDENLTVAEQIMGQLHDARHARLGRRAKSTRERVGDLLAGMELEDVASRAPTDLTLGEIRRFEFARALANEPKVLLIDEPSSGMTAEETRLLSRTIEKIASSGVAIMVIEHNIPFIRALAARTMVLNAGRTIASGPTDAVLASDAVKEAYLGVASNAA